MFPIRIDVGLLPARKTRFYPLPEVYAAVDRYRRDFVAGRRSSNRLYREFSHGKLGTPSLNTILKVAPLNRLLKEVEIAGWEERIRHRADPRIPTPEDIARRRKRRRQACARKPRPQRVLKLIREQGPVSSAEIAAALGYPISTVRGYLHLLREAGLIEFTRPARSRQQRYVIAGADRRLEPPRPLTQPRRAEQPTTATSINATDQPLDDTAPPQPRSPLEGANDEAHGRALPPRPRQILELIHSQGPASAGEISRALGTPLPTVRHDLALLRAASFIAFTRPTRSRNQRYVATAPLPRRVPPPAETRDGLATRDR